MSICATVYYLEFWSDPWVKSYGGCGGGRVRDFYSFFRLFYINFFISTQIYFKFILNIIYDLTVNLNYA